MRNFDEIGDFGRTKNNILDNILLVSVIMSYEDLLYCFSD